MKKLVVNEIFLSINGETSTMGMPTTFIRLAGCNLNCWGGCDTTYALKETAGVEMTIEEIISKVNLLKCPRVCLTGGEPLLKTQESETLLEGLLAKGHKSISVETNGSIDLKPYKNKFSDEIRFTMDLKPPSSGMDKSMVLENLSVLKNRDEIKFVIANQGDFLWALEILQKYNPKAKIIFSPMYKRLEPSKLVEWVLAESLWESRVQLQLHKYIWSPEEKGV